MTRKEKISLCWLMAVVALMAGLSVELLLPGQGFLAGLAAAAIAGWLYTYRVMDRRALYYRNAYLELGKRVLKPGMFFRTIVPNPRKCASCKRRKECPLIEIDKVLMN